MTPSRMAPIADERSHRAGRTQQVAHHRLGRRDRQLVGVVAEGGLDGPRLGDVVERRARAVGDHEVDLVGGQVGVLDRPSSWPSRHRDRWALGPRCGRRRRSGPHPPVRRGWWRRAACACSATLDDEDARALAEEEAVAVLSNGRDAPSGSSLRLESAPMLERAAKPIFSSGASVPPPMTTSTSPRSIMRSASRKVMTLLAQAATWADAPGR